MADIRILKRLLGNMRSEDIAGALEEANWPISGSKGERVGRVLEALFAGDISFPEVLEYAYKDDLASMCVGLGLRMSGSRAVLIGRISEWFDAEFGRRVADADDAEDEDDEDDDQEDSLRELKADELLRKGQQAHRGSDKRLLRECIRELECRSSRAAADAEEHLRNLMRGGGTVRRAQKSAAVDHDDAIIKDADIAYCRESMIAGAECSVWLSSLTFPHADLVTHLTRKARAGVDVTIIVAGGQVRARHDALVRQLDRAGVTCVFPKSTHSKALVIDEELVMVGSANAHGGHRDLCKRFRNRKQAREIIDYLKNLR